MDCPDLVFINEIGFYRNFVGVEFAYRHSFAGDKILLLSYDLPGNLATDVTSARLISLLDSPTNCLSYFAIQVNIVPILDVAPNFYTAGGAFAVVSETGYVYDFLSWGGTVVGMDGPAAGLTSNAIPSTVIATPIELRPRVPRCCFHICCCPCPLPMGCQDVTTCPVDAGPTPVLNPAYSPAWSPVFAPFLPPFGGPIYPTPVYPTPIPPFPPIPPYLTARQLEGEEAGGPTVLEPPRKRLRTEEAPTIAAPIFAAPTVPASPKKRVRTEEAPTIAAPTVPAPPKKTEEAPTIAEPSKKTLLAETTDPWLTQEISAEERKRHLQACTCQIRAGGCACFPVQSQQTMSAADFVGVDDIIDVPEGEEEIKSPSNRTKQYDWTEGGEIVDGEVAEVEVEAYSSASSQSECGTRRHLTDTPPVCMPEFDKPRRIVAGLTSHVDVDNMALVPGFRAKDFMWQRFSHFSPDLPQPNELILCLYNPDGCECGPPLGCGCDYFYYNRYEFVTDNDICGCLSPPSP